MTRHLISINDKAAINEAIMLFNKHNLSCFPVIDGKNNPVGILSWRDIFKALEREI
jgi:acetoin utilization protein AcuB